MINKYTKLASVLAGLLCSFAAFGATTYADNFSGTTASLNWLALNDACLTAGAGGGAIPACSTAMIAAADTAGYGALRLTPAKTYQTGAILSNFTFPSNQGMQVTFTTYTYGGSKDGTANNGADGISFLLTDGTKPQPTVAGASGGSMGYSCSNGNPVYEGLANAYLGLGIDEYGNFLNSGDNTQTGILNSNAPGGTTANGTNSYGNSVGLVEQPEQHLLFGQRAGCGENSIGMLKWYLQSHRRNDEAHCVQLQRNSQWLSCVAE